MKYGYFDDQHQEYVITTPKTPLPWINYLGCGEFFSLISNTCGGYSFYKDAKLMRLTRYRYNNVPYDSNGKYFYIKEGNQIWNPGWQPTRTDLDIYECHHGMGYSRFISEKNKVLSEVLTFVPLHDFCEISTVKIQNESHTEKQLQLFSYVEWCLWNADDDLKNFQRNLSTGEVEISGSTIFHKTEYRERRNHYAFYSVNSPIHGFDTDRNAFIGTYNGMDKPAAVLNGQCTNSIAHGWSPIAAQQLNFSLQPGESKTFVFVLGFAENPSSRKWEQPDVINKQVAWDLLKKYDSVEKVASAFENLRQYWQALLSTYHVTSENEKVDRMVNIWHQYQCMVTFNMSRSASYYESGIGRGMGFRDSCQDILGFVHLIPERARQRILDIAATQFADGSAYHQYQPLTKQGNSDIGSGFNDDPLWLIACVSAYIRETGDLSILKESVPFNNDSNACGCLLEHLKCSFEFTVKHKGPHGLPLIGRADWNDCLNLNCFSKQPGESFQTFGPSYGPVAESIFIAGMFVKYGREYLELCNLIHSDPGFTSFLSQAQAPLFHPEHISQEIDAMYKAVINYGWDGEWFLRAYDAAGQKVGSRECPEGQIYIEPQGFCVLAGIGVKEGLAKMALQSVAKRLDSPYGIMLLQPAYRSYHLELGEVSSYPPGYKENAGIFCHNNPWVSIAETVVGHGKRAFEIYQKTCPAYLEAISEIHKTEPYIYSQMVAGMDAVLPGEGKNSWLTGTAAWTFCDISQYILGIYPTFTGLSVNPCIPADFGSYHVTRKFRDAIYDITVENPDRVEKGVKQLLVDGVEMKGTIIPLAAKHATCSVTVLMG